MTGLPYSTTPQIFAWSSQTMRASGEVRVDRDFWTWQEAMIVARKAAQQATTRPQVRRRGNQWRLTYNTRPITYNQK